MKTKMSKDRFERLMSTYALGLFLSSKAINKGTVQEVHLLETDQGKYILKSYNRSMESIEFELTVLNLLSKHNFSCLKPCKNSVGKSIQLLDGKPCVIYEYIEGVHIENPSELQMKELVIKVAELHNITEGYQPKVTSSRLNYNVEQCKLLVEKEVIKLGTEHAKLKLEWYLKEIESLQLPQSLPKGICHGDFNFTNVIYRNDKFEALIDFDDANYTYLIFDLVHLAYPFTEQYEWNTWYDFDMNEPIFDFERAKKIIDIYELVRPLTCIEKLHFFDVVKLSILIDCIWYFSRGDASHFFEGEKIRHLNTIGRNTFYKRLFNQEK